MSKTENQIITPNRELVVPTHLQKKDKFIYVMMDMDTFLVIRSLVSATTGKPKSAVIQQCFGLGCREKDIEYAIFKRKNDKEYPRISIRYAVTPARYGQAKIHAMANKLRYGEDENMLFVALGFNPEELKEGQ